LLDVDVATAPTAVPTRLQTRQLWGHRCSCTYRLVHGAAPVIRPCHPLPHRGREAAAVPPRPPRLPAGTPAPTTLAPNGRAMWCQRLQCPPLSSCRCAPARCRFRLRCHAQCSLPCLSPSRSPSTRCRSRSRGDWQGSGTYRAVLVMVSGGGRRGVGVVAWRRFNVGFCLSCAARASLRRRRRCMCRACLRCCSLPSPALPPRRCPQQRRHPGVAGRWDASARAGRRGQGQRRRRCGGPKCRP
jgi:hypothetical protein